MTEPVHSESNVKEVRENKPFFDPLTIGLICSALRSAPVNMVATAVISDSLDKTCIFHAMPSLPTASSQSQHEMQSRSTLKVVLGRCFVVRPSFTVSSLLLRSRLFSLLQSCPSKAQTPVTRQRDDTYICFPPKIRRCCTGGMPSFSSTRSLILDTL